MAGSQGPRGEEDVPPKGDPLALGDRHPAWARTATSPPNRVSCAARGRLVGAGSGGHGPLTRLFPILFFSSFPPTSVFWFPVPSSWYSILPPWTKTCPLPLPHPPPPPHPRFPSHCPPLPFQPPFPDCVALHLCPDLPIPVLLSGLGFSLSLSLGPCCIDGYGFARHAGGSRCNDDAWRSL
eukprot:363620-Chlamydomonas_euryale.AAC.7